MLAALQALNANAAEDRRDALFPGRQRHRATPTASPKIWEDMAGFQAKIDKFKADAAAAAAAAACQDVEALEGAVGAIGGDLRRLPRDLSHQEELIAA